MNPLFCAAILCIFHLLAISSAWTVDLSTMVNATGAASFSSGLVGVAAPGEPTFTLSKGAPTLDAKYLGWRCNTRAVDADCAETSPLDFNTPTFSIVQWVTLDDNYRTGAKLISYVTRPNGVASAANFWCSADVPISFFMSDGSVFAQIYNGTNCQAMSFTLPPELPDKLLPIVFSVYPDEDVPGSYFALFGVSGNDILELPIGGVPFNNAASQLKLVFGRDGWKGIVHKVVYEKASKSLADCTAIFAAGLAVRPPFVSSTSIQLTTTTTQTYTIHPITSHVLPHTISLISASQDALACLILTASVVGTSGSASTPTIVTQAALPITNIATVASIRLNTTRPECISSARSFVYELEVKLTPEVSSAIRQSATETLTVLASGFSIPEVTDSSDTLSVFSETPLSSIFPRNNNLASLTIESLPENGELYITSSGIRTAISSVPFTTTDFDHTLSFLPYYLTRPTGGLDTAPLAIMTTPLLTTGFSFHVTGVNEFVSNTARKSISVSNTVLSYADSTASIPNKSHSTRLSVLLGMSGAGPTLQAADFQLVLSKLPSAGRIFDGDMEVALNMLPYLISDSTELTFRAPSDIAVAGALEMSYFWMHKFFKIASSTEQTLLMTPAPVNLSPTVSQLTTSPESGLLVGEWHALNISISDVEATPTSTFIVTAIADTSFVYLRSNVTRTDGSVTVTSETKSRVHFIFARRAL